MREANENTMYYDGLIDDLRVYDHVLSAEEVQSIPEPATLFLMSIGGIFLRRKK